MQQTIPSSLSFAALRDLEFDSLANGLRDILEKCNKVLMNFVLDAVQGILKKKKFVLITVSFRLSLYAVSNYELL